MQEPQLHELQSTAWLNPSIPGSLLLHVVEDLAAQHAFLSYTAAAQGTTKVAQQAEPSKAV